MKRVLDLFCKAGGAAMGLHRAWPNAEIIGVDIEPQPRYPFIFVQADAIEFPLDGFDFIWASPPCQRYTALKPTFDSAKYDDLVPSVRARLRRANSPWVIENVPGSPLISSIVLCGAMFGLRVYRHRLFESSHLLFQPPEPRHKIKASSTRISSKRAWLDGLFITVCGSGGNTGKWAGYAMGIDWMNNRELGEAIPPAYSEYIARQFGS